MPDGHATRPRARPRIVRSLAWIAAAATAVVSLGPQAESIAGEQPSDKLLHLLVYAPLTVLFLTAEVGVRRSASHRRAAAVIGAVVLYGAALEGLQAFLPHRTAEALDLLANGVGVALGTLLWVTARRGRYDLKGHLCPVDDDT